MFYNLKITLRNLRRGGVYSWVNIGGLSIGLAVVLLISLLIFNELSFDKSFKESKHIYRINSFLTAFMPGETFCITGNATGPAMQEAIPEVIAAVRTIPNGYVTRINNHPLRIKVIWADTDFFRLFNTPFLYGTPETVMSHPNAIAISEETAKTLFGTDNPIGETFSLDNQHLMEVVAVFQDYPANSSFRGYKMIAPFMYSYPSWFHEKIQWSGTDYETFCLLSEKTDITYMNTKMEKVISEATEGNNTYYPVLQPLNDIHLHSADYRGSYTSSKSDIGKVNMMAALAAIILLLACINYMNLSTARAQKRSKEIGVSKTIGAKRNNLIIRLLLEAGIFTFVSFVVAYILVIFTLPVFNTLMGEQLDVKLLFQPLFLGVAVLIWMITTLFSALYPAIYLSGFPPLKAIRQGVSTGKSSHATVRKILTVWQFAIAIVLIAWVLIIHSQISFLHNKELGYSLHNLVEIPLGSSPDDFGIRALVNDYRAESSVEMVCLYGAGNIQLKYADDETVLPLVGIAADPDYIELMQMKLIAGRTLPEQHGDSMIHIILNRAAVDDLGIKAEEAPGKRLVYARDGTMTEICGVVENFNFESLYHSVSGFGIHDRNIPKRTIILRFKAGNLTDRLQKYEQIFRKHYPNELFEPKYPDLEMEKAYENERRTNRIAIVFSVLAIWVACMGVFGLTAFMAEQRTKEIGIRKVLGARVIDIVRMFSDSYLKLLLISQLIAIPVAWWVGNLYLQNFAYRISTQWWIFAVASLITVILTLLTVGWQALKAATANPVDAIKSE